MYSGCVEHALLFGYFGFNFLCIVVVWMNTLLFGHFGFNFLCIVVVWRNTHYGLDILVLFFVYSGYVEHALLFEHFIFYV